MNQQECDQLKEDAKTLATLVLVSVYQEAGSRMPQRIHDVVMPYLSELYSKGEESFEQEMDALIKRVLELENVDEEE